MKRRNAFTLIETLVAIAVGGVVFGGGMYLYVSGNKSFQVATEHASLREEALVCLETISRDLDQLMVADDKNPTTGNFYLVEPYSLGKFVNQTGVDPNDGQMKTYPVASELTFFRYHHTGPNPKSTTTPPAPALYADKLIYSTIPIAGDPKKGLNLLRNGEVINHIPLSGVLFETINPQLAVDNVGGAPKAVLRITVVPRGGMWGTMTPDTVQKLRDSGEVLSRVFHLVGYESEYTSYLSLALSKIRRVDQNATPPITQTDITAAKAQQNLSDLEEALLNNASFLPPQQFAAVFAKLKTSPSLNYSMPDSSVICEPSVAFNDTPQVPTRSSRTWPQSPVPSRPSARAPPAVAAGPEAALTAVALTDRNSKEFERKKPSATSFA